MYGVLGAAYATLAAYMAALLVSIFLGKRAFVLPVPVVDTVKIILSTLVMGLAMRMITFGGNIYIELLVSGLIGGLSYLLSIIVLGVVGTRNFLSGQCK